MKSAAVPLNSEAPDFTLPRADGSTRALGELRGERVVLLFYRGHWCGSCRAQLEEVRRSALLFADAGARVLAISSESPERAQAAIIEHGLTFEVLCDESLTVIDRYGVRHTDEPDGRRIARPSIFLIDRAGVVRFAHVGENANDRPTVAHVLLAIEAL